MAKGDKVVKRDMLSWYDNWPRWSHMLNWARNTYIERSMPLIVILPVLSVLVSEWNTFRESYVPEQGESVREVAISAASGSDILQSPEDLPCDSEDQAAKPFGLVAWVAMQLPVLHIPTRLKVMFIGLLLISAASFVFSIGIPLELRFLPGQTKSVTHGRPEWCLALLASLNSTLVPETASKNHEELVSHLYHPRQVKKLKRMTVGDGYATWTIARWNTLDSSRRLLRYLTFLLFLFGFVCFFWATAQTLWRVVGG